MITTHTRSRQMDEHQSNSTTIRSINASRAKIVLSPSHPISSLNALRTSAGAEECMRSPALTSMCSAIQPSSRAMFDAMRSAKHFLPSRELPPYPLPYDFTLRSSGKCASNTFSGLHGQWLITFSTHKSVTRCISARLQFQQTAIQKFTVTTMWRYSLLSGSPSTPGVSQWMLRLT